MDIYQLITSLHLHRLEVRFTPQGIIEMPSWIGAVLRNRFLYAAHEVNMPEGKTLYDWINTFPYTKEHPYYKLLSGGFPKGFFFDCSTLPWHPSGFRLDPDHVYTFTLTLIGRCAEKYLYFIESLLKMCAGGMGHPMVPLTLIDITELGGTTIYNGEEQLVYPLTNPLHLDASIPPPEGKLAMALQMITPVALVNHSRKSENDQGYQGKLNNFPSFYQFIRSALHRMLTLYILYQADGWTETPQQLTDVVDQYIQPATRALLIAADIRYEKRYSTPKVGKKQVYAMAGYCGQLAFGQVPAHYFPLMQLCSLLGVGNDINYGLGIFTVTEI